MEDLKETSFKKNIIVFLLIGILLLAIPFAVKLVGQQQQLRSKAATEAGSNIKFGEGVVCEGDQCFSDSTDINLEITAPDSLEWE